MFLCLKTFSQMALPERFSDAAVWPVVRPEISEQKIRPPVPVLNWTGAEERRMEYSAWPGFYFGSPKGTSLGSFSDVSLNFTVEPSAVWMVLASSFQLRAFAMVPAVAASMSR